MGVGNVSSPSLAPKIGDPVKYIYKINPNLGHEDVDIEADSYSLDDGYFHFWEGFSSGNRSKVASVATAVVSEVRRTDKE